MITPDYIRLMTVYNHWQNDNLLAAADGIGEEARRAECGAFFGSIYKTLNHILWADQIWMHRLAATPKPAAGSIQASLEQYDDWDAYKSARRCFDDTMIAWSRRVGPSDLTGELSWYSGAAKKEITKPRALLIAHMFNHQTHHRGQVHAMLTAADARPGDTDIPLMPENYRARL